MSDLPRELHKTLLGTGFAAPVQTVVCSLDVSETDDVTIPVLVANRRVRVVSASYIQESDATAATDFTAQLLNGATAVSDALDIADLGADTPADFAGVPTDGDEILEDGDVLDIDFDQTGGTVTAPDRVLVTLEIQLLE